MRSETEAQADEAEAVAVDLFRTQKGRSDPYPSYHRLRTLAPVHRSETARAWLLTRYEDCRAVLRDPRFEKRYAETLDARSAKWRERPGLVWSSKTLLNLDGPAHARLRRRVFRWFTRRPVERLRDSIASMVEELLDDFASSGGGDLMERVAFPLPVSVIGEMLGVPRADLAPFREQVLALTTVFEVGAGREARDAADVAALDLGRYFEALIAQKRAHPADDLLTQLTQAADDRDGDGLTDDEINTMAIVLFAAGFETTTNLIGNGVMALLDQPEQIALLRQRPELFATLPDELLRHGGTVQLLGRFTTEDVPIGDVTIPAGEAVFPLIGAANRDPARYPDPDRLDVTRPDIRPLAFGGGVHHCLGAALALLEIEIVFRRLIDRFDDIALAGCRPPHRDRLTLRGPDSVPVRLGRRPEPEAVEVRLPARPADDDAAWRAAYRRRLEDAGAAPSREELALRVALLERVPLFAACAAAELALLAATAYPIAFDPGEILCREGADAPDCYVIAEGEATITIAGKDVATVGADDAVGERGPIEDLPRAATVTAATHMLTYAISRERLRRLMEANPTAAKHMRDLLSERYSG